MAYLASPAFLEVEPRADAECPPQLRVRVKNTFIDDFDDIEGQGQRSGEAARLSRTCPPELELSPEQEAAEAQEVHVQEHMSLRPPDFSQQVGLLRAFDDVLEWDPVTQRLPSWRPPTQELEPEDDEDLDDIEEQPPTQVVSSRAYVPPRPVARLPPAKEIESSSKGVRAPAPGTSVAPTPLRRGRGANRHRQKLWCHLYLSEDMLTPGFELNKKVIGHNGCCTRGIFDATGAKIRLRGRGSKHFEGGREAPVHLMLAITAEKGELESFTEAARLCAEHLSDIERRFRSFCRQRQLPQPQGRCFWVGESAQAAESFVEAALEDVAARGEDNKGKKTVRFAE